MSSTVSTTTQGLAATVCPHCSSQRIFAYDATGAKQQCYDCKFYLVMDGRRWDAPPEELKDEEDMYGKLELPDNIVRAVATHTGARCWPAMYNVVLTLADGSEVKLEMKQPQLDARKKTLEKGRILTYASRTR